MDPVEKSLWFIENHFDKDIGLDEIAAAAGISRYHLSRVFGLATGYSVMGYVRGRRLTLAAAALAAGAPDILAVALDAGYGSHEAFTRAFRELFGLTPEQVRANGALTNLPLVEPIRMNRSLAVTLEPPRFVDAPTLLIAGLSGHYAFTTNQGIPAQWQRFNREFAGGIPDRKGALFYGLSHNFDDEAYFEYVCGVEVTRFGDQPTEFARVRIDPHRYAVFTHRDHISSISATHYAIMGKWAMTPGNRIAEALNFERYDDRFDPMTGLGGVEIWIPVEASGSSQ